MICIAAILGGATGVAWGLSQPVGFTEERVPLRRPSLTRAPGKHYTIADGDTLLKIARRETGDARNWMEIYRINQPTLDYACASRDVRPTPNMIFAGTQIIIPNRLPFTPAA